MDAHLEYTKRIGGKKKRTTEYGDVLIFLQCLGSMCWSSCNSDGCSSGIHKKNPKKQKEREQKNMGMC